MQTGNLFNIASEVLDARDETFEALAQSAGTLVERIVSTGQTTPPGEWYDQERDEWVALLQGSARLEFEDADDRTLSAGDYLLIPAHKKHRVVYTSANPPCVWLAVHAELCEV